MSRTRHSDTLSGRRVNAIRIESESTQQYRSMNRLGNACPLDSATVRREGKRYEFFGPSLILNEQVTNCANPSRFCDTIPTHAEKLTRNLWIRSRNNVAKIFASSKESSHAGLRYLARGLTRSRDAVRPPLKQWGLDLLLEQGY